MRRQVTDDSGFLALVDPDAYQGYVGSAWTLDQLRTVFIREMARRTLLIWGTGGEGLWTVELALDSAGRGGIGELVGGIVSTRGRLLLTNYESLSVAAQFPDVTLPEEHQHDLLFAAPPGALGCRIIATGDSTPTGDPPAPDFVVELQPVAQLGPACAGVPWTAELSSKG